MHDILSTAFEVLGIASDEQRVVFDTIVKYSQESKRIQGLARVEKLVCNECYFFSFLRTLFM